MAEIQTPELDKMEAARPMTQAAAEFFDWLTEQDFELAKRSECGYYLTPVMESKDKLLARWQDLDLDACEKERQAILDNFIKSQEG